MTLVGCYNSHHSHRLKVTAVAVVAVVALAAEDAVRTSSYALI
jgi:hypothetical protein